MRDLYQPFTKTDAGIIGDKIGIDWSTVEFSVDQFLAGLNVELEHGTKSPETNITDDDPLMTAKIVWAHLNEKADYYDLLAQVEQADQEENTMQPKQASPMRRQSAQMQAGDFVRRLDRNSELYMTDKISYEEHGKINYDLWDQIEQADPQVKQLVLHMLRQGDPHSTEYQASKQASLKQSPRELAQDFDQQLEENTNLFVDGKGRRAALRQANGLVPFVLTSEEADAWAGFDRSSFSTFYDKLKERPDGSARGHLDFYTAYGAARSLESKLETGYYPDLSKAEEEVLLNLGSRLEVAWRKARGENTASARQAVVQRCRPTDCPDKDPKDKRWCLLTHDKKKALKCAPSREEAAEHEKSVNYFSHQGRTK